MVWVTVSVINVRFRVMGLCGGLASSLVGRAAGTVVVVLDVAASDSGAEGARVDRGAALVGAVAVTVDGLEKQLARLVDDRRVGHLLERRAMVGDGAGE